MNPSLLKCLWAIIVCCFGLHTVWAETPRPNIVLLLADDLGFGDVGFNGHPVIQTPHMDRLAADGIQLNRFYAQSTTCSPTRASVLTGRNGYRFGITWANTGLIRPEELTLAEAFQQAGYRTGHFGKWHVGSLTTEIRDGNRGGRPEKAHEYAPPWLNGFDASFVTESKVPTWDPMVMPKNARRTWWDPQSPEDDPDDWVPYNTRYWTGPGEYATENLEGDDSRVIMDRVIPFIEEAVEADQPFFSIVWFHTPHLPVVAGPEFTQLYEGYRSFEKHYYGCITAMDLQVGRLREVLGQLGVEDNTLIFFGSDNGPEMNNLGTYEPAPGSSGPFRGAKRDLLEGGIRVPAFAYWPAGLEGGRVTEFPMATSDYFPTLMELIGVDVEQWVTPLDGMDVMPFLVSGKEARPGSIGFEHRDEVALMTYQYKLYSSDGGQTFALYDLLNDPGETVNLAWKLPALVTEMKQDLEAWRVSCRASLAGEDYR